MARRQTRTGIPYHTAKSGNGARLETEKLLRGFGCEEVGFSDKYDEQKLVLYFRYHGQHFRPEISARGWAAWWLKENPLSHRARKSEQEHRQEALRQGHLAVSSILRDLIKSQLTAVKCGALSFTEVFMPFMLTSDGQRLIDRVKDVLPTPKEKVVALPPRAVNQE